MSCRNTEIHRNIKGDNITKVCYKFTHIQLKILESTSTIILLKCSRLIKQV